jgi:hypothetical protein
MKDSPRYSIPGLMPANTPNNDARIFSDFDGSVDLTIDVRSEPSDPISLSWFILYNDNSIYSESSDNSYTQYLNKGGELVTLLSFPAEVIPLGTWKILVRHDNKTKSYRVTRKLF